MNKWKSRFVTALVFSLLGVVMWMLARFYALAYVWALGVFAAAGFTALAILFCKWIGPTGVSAPLSLPPMKKHSVQPLVTSKIDHAEKTEKAKAAKGKPNSSGSTESRVDHSPSMRATPPSERAKTPSGWKRAADMARGESWKPDEVWQGSLSELIDEVKAE